jgi:hypothetical protein
VKRAFVLCVVSSLLPVVAMGFVWQVIVAAFGAGRKFAQQVEL